MSCDDFMNSPIADEDMWTHDVFGNSSGGCTNEMGVSGGMYYQIATCGGTTYWWWDDGGDFGYGCSY